MSWVRNIRLRYSYITKSLILATSISCQTLPLWQGVGCGEWFGGIWAGVDYFSDLILWLFVGVKDVEDKRHYNMIWSECFTLRIIQYRGIKVKLNFIHQRIVDYNGLVWSLPAQRSSGTLYLVIAELIITRPCFRLSHGACRSHCAFFLILRFSFLMFFYFIYFSYYFSLEFFIKNISLEVQ